MYDSHHASNTNAELVRSASPEAWVGSLESEALTHRAVCHPYLRALRDGTLPDPTWALRDFARQYRGYSVAFPLYLKAVICRLEDPMHREALTDNLNEESGGYGEEELEELASIGVDRTWVEGVPHPELFMRFSDAMGVQPSDHVEPMVACWRDQLLATLRDGSAAEALGALGLGTEHIVSTIYQSFVAACERDEGLSAQDAVFFTLHTAIDDDHQETLRQISLSYATTDAGRQALRLGMIKALVCRAAFWDWMHARALHPERHREEG